MRCADNEVPARRESPVHLIEEPDDIVHVLDKVVAANDVKAAL